MNWRRIVGAIAMTAGAAIAALMAAAAVFLTANYLEPENAADGLTTIAVATAPGFAAGLVFILAGRAAYGEWRDRRPIRRAAPWALLVLGAPATAGFAGLLVILATGGIGPQHQPALLNNLLGLAAGVAALFLARRLASRNSPAGRPAS